MELAATDHQTEFARRPETIGDVQSKAPMTGAEYLESIGDGREIYIYGERVKDVTTHPAFRNTARMIARLYDALHDPAAQRQVAAAHRHRQRRRDSRLLQGAAHAEATLAGRDAIAAWQRLTYGWLGRSPDYKAAFLATLGANADSTILPGERPALVQVQPGTRAVHESRHHPSAGRPRPAAERDRRRLRARREGNRCRSGRLRGQGRSHRLRAHELHVRRPSRAHSRPRQTLRFRLHGAVEHAGREVHLPAVVRDDVRRRWAAPSTIRCRAAWTRTTPCSSSTTR